MMKNNLIYYIMTYIMYLYPPFIFFMVMINFDAISDTNNWIIGIITNIIMVGITTLVLYILALKNKIPKIDKDEGVHFIFGYIGNIIVFLYVYQYLMNIERLVSVFSLVLILVIAYKYLISKKITFKEILIFSIVFGVIDYIIIITSGNTLFSETSNFTNAESIVFQVLLLMALAFTIGWYVYKLYRNHQWTLLRNVLIGFIVISLLLYYIEVQEEIVATVAIITVFTWLIDIIMRLIHKEFKVFDLVCYARLIMVTVILLLIKEMELYVFPNFELEQMFLLIAIFYVTAFSDIIMNITPKKKEAIDLNLTIEEYIKELYKSLTSRYKDVLVYADNEMIKHDLHKLGRDIIIKSNIDDFKDLDDNAISFVIIYSHDIEKIQAVLENIKKLNVCIISDQAIKNDILKTSFTDFKDYVYTI